VRGVKPAAGRPTVGCAGGKPLVSACLLELFLARQHLVAQRDEVDVGLARLGEHALRSAPPLLDVVLDLFAQHLDLGVVEFVVRAAGHDVVDQHLGAVVLDIGLASRSSSILPSSAG
jgi:hypothetical protein